MRVKLLKSAAGPNFSGHPGDIVSIHPDWLKGLQDAGACGKPEPEPVVIAEPWTQDDATGDNEVEETRDEPQAETATKKRKPKRRKK